MSPSLSRRSFAAVLAAAAAVPAAAFASPVASSPYAVETALWTNGLLLDGDGQSFVLRDMKRPLTLLKLWAGWCPACAYEMPLLAELAARTASRLEVVLVSHPQYWAQDQVVARRRNLPFRLATFAPGTPGPLVAQALTDQAGQYAVPRTLVFRERDHAIVARREGATDWSTDTALNQVRTWLA